MNGSKTLLCALVLVCYGGVASAATLNGSVAITGWSGSFVDDQSAGGVGYVYNNISEYQDNAYGTPYYPTALSGDVDYGVTNQSGSAASNANAGTATVELDLDVAGSPKGQTAGGLSSAGFSGITNDVEAFTVDFKVDFDASGSSPQSYGAFGVWVAAYSWNTVTGEKTNLAWSTPVANSDLLSGTEHLNYLPVPDRGFLQALFFDYGIFDTADGKVTDGKLSDEISVAFGFTSIDGDNLVDVVEITAFTYGQMTAVPLPAAFPLYGAGIAVLGFIGLRRKRKAVVTV